MAEAAVGHHRHKSVTSCDTKHAWLESPHRQDRRWKWDAKEGGNDAIFESDEEVDEAWRSRAGGAPKVGRLDGEEGVSTGLDLKSRDKSINADDARQRSLGKVGRNHLEKFWQVNERRRWGIMSGWKWNGKSVAAEVRGVLLISVTLEWDFSPRPLRPGRSSTYFTWWDFRRLRSPKERILWFWLW